MRFLALGALLCAAALAGAQGDSAAVQALKAFRFGSDRSALDAVSREVDAARADPARRAALAQGLASVLSSDAAFDAKQFACRQLALVGGEAQIPALAALLQDDALSHYALYALARIPGSAVDSALLAALPRSKGPARLGIMDALGERRATSAIATLAEALKSGDSAEADAAADALAKIGSPPAAQVLRRSYEAASPMRRDTLGGALARCGERLLASGERAAALSLFELLDRSAQNPSVRAAALRGIALAKGEAALPLLAHSLGEENGARLTVALDLARTLPGARIAGQLLGELSKLPARNQALLIEALGARGDRSIGPRVLPLVKGADPAIRLAALRALAALGDGSAVPTLLEAAAGSGESREAARVSLARLNGADVDARLAAAMERAEPKLQVEAIRALGQRGGAGVEKLIQAARSKEAAVSAAALRALRDTAGPEQADALLDLLLAKPPGERDEVMEAIATVLRRVPDENLRAHPVLQRYSAVTATADRADLIVLLGQLGGAQTLRVIRPALSDAAPEVQIAALRALADWGSAEPIHDVNRVLKSAQNDTVRSLALRAYLHMIEHATRIYEWELLDLFKGVSSSVKTPEERRLFWAALARIHTPRALEYIESNRTLDGAEAEADLAKVELIRKVAGSVGTDAAKDLNSIIARTTSDAVRNRAKETLAMLEKVPGFLLQWQVTPAYAQEGADYSRLFDLPFGPEDPQNLPDVPWKPLSALTNPEQPWLVDLLAAHGGEQRVAYLRTAAVVDSERDVILSLGSDDGIIAWWNGQEVLARNVARAVNPGDQKVRVKARHGANVLVLKVTQNVLGWGAAVQVTELDGSPASTVRTTLPIELAHLHAEINRPLARAKPAPPGSGRGSAQP